MELIRTNTSFDFIGTRRLPIVISLLLTVVTTVSFFTRGLNFGLDFTGGTLVEIGYAQPIEVAEVRRQLAGGGFPDAVVQHFGTARELMVRIPLQAGKESVAVSNTVVEALRRSLGETAVDSRPGEAQKCTRATAAGTADCQLQVRRVEFVGPQVGGELVEKGGLALIYTSLAILIYVMFRFEWRFAVASIVASIHDVWLVFGFFSLTQMEFSLTVLAAILAVLGYSLNDTIVIFDRIRENFRKMRRSGVIEIMNASLNQTLSRTFITSGTTLLTVLSLFFLGGEIVRGFSTALIIGLLVGTYSSLYIATPAVLALGISREDLLPAKKEGAEPTQP